MPTLGAPLDFAKLEGRNLRAHQLGTAPSSPVTGQLYYNTADNTLYWFDGTVWVSTRGSGAPPDATAATKGLVQLAGDLAGTAASPQIAAGVITDAEVAAANKDGAVTTPGMRTLGQSPGQAMRGNIPLNLIFGPALDMDFGGVKLTNVADPATQYDAATKGYVDAVAQGLDAKASVRFASTGNMTLSGFFMVDNYMPVDGDRILVKDQTTASQNGIYIAHTGAWTRAADLDTSAEAISAFVFVEQGTVNGDTGWISTIDPGFVLNTNAMTWTQFSGAGQLVAGAGLTKTGNQIDIYAAGQSGIVVNADSIQLSPDAARYYSTGTHGAGTAISITPGNHGLKANQGIQVQVLDKTSGLVELPDMAVTALGVVNITYAVSVAANSKQITLVGTGV